MTTDQEMQQLADQATDGPWEAFEDNNGYPYNEWLVCADNGDQQIIDWGNGSTKADAQFIAACREWVPDALKRLEAVRELQNKIARHAQQDWEEGRPAAALLTQIANDLNQALEGK